MKWLHNIKIRSKLITSFILVAILAGAVGIVGTMDLNTLKTIDKEIYTENMEPIASIHDVQVTFDQIEIDLRDMIFDKDLSMQGTYINSIQSNTVKMAEKLAAFKNTVRTIEGLKVINILEGSISDYQTYTSNIMELVKNNKQAEAYTLVLTNGKAISNAARDGINELVKMKLDSAREKSISNTKTADQSTRKMLFIALGAMVLAIGLGGLMSRIIGKPLRKLVETTGKMAEGDLNVTIDNKSKDEIGILAGALEKMVDNLNDVLLSITTATDQVASGANQASDSSMALSQGATEQASSIEELSASIEEIAAQTNHNAENAKNVNEVAKKIEESAAQGNNRMNEMLKAMDEINEASASISKIVKAIDDIAFQTNILALNAAVEAARAGQHGKGFAVVAEEVRNLAARSANAAKETTTMIEGSIKRIEAGTKIANETAKALNEIVEGVDKAGSLVNEIATASNEQALGIAQINQGINQVSRVVQTNSATSEESASASEELSSQVELMREQISRFKLRNSMLVNNNFDNLDKEMTDNEALSDEAEAEAAATKVKIDLDDKEFGKY